MTRPGSTDTRNERVTVPGKAHAKRLRFIRYPAAMAAGIFDLPAARIWGMMAERKQFPAMHDEQDDKTHRPA